MTKFFKNFARFFYDPVYQEEVNWVKWVISKASFIHHHIWTVLRFPGGIITIWLDMKYGFLCSLISLLFFALTDWFDGKVKRHRSKMNMRGWLDELSANRKLGSVLDGTADKLFIIPVIFYWGWDYCFVPLLYLMAVIEGAGNLYLFYLEKRDKMNKGRNIYEHLGVGKFKFTLQIVLASFLWLTKMHSFEFSEMIANFLLSIIVVLAFLSVFCKAKPAVCEKLWQSSEN